MNQLQNGIRVFNGTPHVIRFWFPEWSEPIEVEPDQAISAKVKETRVKIENCIEFATPAFVPTDEGRAIIKAAYEAGADIIVGSIIAAQAYPGQVVAMVPCEGYERVPPAEKRMRPDKFTIFSDGYTLTVEQADAVYGLAYQGSIGQYDLEFLDRVFPDLHERAEEAGIR